MVIEYILAMASCMHLGLSVVHVDGASWYIHILIHMSSSQKNVYIEMSWRSIWSSPA
jgi:hypothetical protein